MLVDSSDMTISQVVQRILDIYREKRRKTNESSNCKDSRLSVSACRGLIDKVYELIGQNVGETNFYTLGPIIHNEGVVEDLASKGVQVISGKDIHAPSETLQEWNCGDPIPWCRKNRSTTRLKEKGMFLCRCHLFLLFLKIHRIVEKESLAG